MGHRTGSEGDAGGCVPQTVIYGHSPSTLSAHRRTVAAVTSPIDRVLNAVSVALGSLILTELRQIEEGIRLVTDATGRIETAITGIQGDIDGLKESAANLQSALEDAIANQPQDVQDQINAAVAEAQAAFDAQLEAIATKLEDLDAQTSENPEGGPQPDNTLPNEIPVEGEPPVVDPRQR